MVFSQSIPAGTRQNIRRIRPTLRGDLRRAVPDFAAALLFAGIVFAIQAARARAGVDPALLEMPSMRQSGGVWPYSLSQSFGWAALLWSWATILLGVSLPVWGSKAAPGPGR